MPSPENASTSASASPAPEDVESKEPVTFKSIGLIDPLLEALDQLNFKAPTEIQQQSLPHALEGRDIIGVAETGSGKTAAFALPILQKLWEEPKGLFACVLAPTRELAYQIAQQFEALGAAMGARCATIVGGMDLPTQAIALAKRPHVVVATPGRLLQHLEETKGFSLRMLKFLVSTNYAVVNLFDSARLNESCSGARRGRSSLGHGLWPCNRQNSEAHPQGANDISFLCYNDIKSCKAATSKFGESCAS